MRAIVIVLLALMVALPTAARDPTNKAECVQTLKPMLESRCQQLFTDSEQRSACTQQVAPQVERTCDQFFGQGQDFCASCTGACTQNFASGDQKRRECLTMCLSQPGCE